MPFDYDADASVAVQEREDEDFDDEVRASSRRMPRLDRAICPKCRMLLSVFETRRGKCRTCHTELPGATN